MINETDQSRGDWLGKFSVAIGKIALVKGYKMLALLCNGAPPVGAKGDPFNTWKLPSVVEYSKLCSKYPDRLGVALHEYSNSDDPIWNEYPWLVGRIEHLMDTCDDAGIRRPITMFTEWGWGANHLPEQDKAIQQMADVMEKVYAPYFPEVQAAFTWYLGLGWGDIAVETNRLIQPHTNMTLTQRFSCSGHEMTRLSRVP